MHPDRYVSTSMARTHTDLVASLFPPGTPALTLGRSIPCSMESRSQSLGESIKPARELCDAAATAGQWRKARLIFADAAADRCVASIRSVARFIYQRL